MEISIVSIKPHFRDVFTKSFCETDDPIVICNDFNMIAIRLYLHNRLALYSPLMNGVFINKYIERIMQIIM